MQGRSEKHLREGIRAGRREACEQFVRANYAAVYRFLVHLTRDASLSEDLTQETFASAWQKIGDFEGKARLATWLHQIAYRKLLNVWRSRQRRAVLAMHLALHRSDAEQPSPADALMANERSRRLSGAVQSLREAERLLIVLHYFQGLSYHEMATVLGEAVGTLKWRTSRALTQLKELLSANIDHENATNRTMQKGDVRIVGGGA